MVTHHDYCQPSPTAHPTPRRRGRLGTTQHLQRRHVRRLTWSRHDAAGVIVAVAGAQFADGYVERSVELQAESPDVELTAAAARMLAAALLNAADSFDRLR